MHAKLVGEKRIKKIVSLMRLLAARTTDCWFLFFFTSYTIETADLCTYPLSLTYIIKYLCLLLQ